MGANVAGADFITAIVKPDGSVEIVVIDVKTSEHGKFPAAKTQLPGTLRTEVQDAIGPSRLNLSDPAFEARIRAAFQQGRIRLRQLHANYFAVRPGKHHGLVSPACKQSIPHEQPVSCNRKANWGQDCGLPALCRIDEPRRLTQAIVVPWSRHTSSTAPTVYWWIRRSKNVRTRS